jgi:co-chaperonin GroES (HSP10)
MYVSDEDIKAAKELIANGKAEPVGYRVMVKSIFVDTEMELSLQGAFPTLAEIDFQDKTDEEAERQSRGTYFGLVVDTGEYAYGGGRLGDAPWVEKGDVAIFERYAGVGINLPPGSDNEFRFMNDENILGRMKPTSEVEHGD